jgi:hypothetical protein
MTGRMVRGAISGATCAAGVVAGTVIVLDASSRSQPGEGPPRAALPGLETAGGVAVAVLTVAVVALLAWQPGLGGRRNWRARGGALLGVIVAVGLGGAAVYADVKAPYTRTICARDGVHPHHVSCSYHSRNTPLAQDRAGYLGLAGIAVAVGTLAGVTRVERRKAVAGRRGRAVTARA